MGEKKEDKPNSELDEQLQKLIREGAENLDILNNENLLDFLKNKKIVNAPSLPFFKEFKESLLLASINTERYDKYLNKWMETSSLTFFSEIKRILKISKQKNKAVFDQLLSRFLNLVAIRKIKKTPINLVQQGLMDDRMLNLEKRFEEKEVRYINLSNEINLNLKDIKERGEKLKNSRHNIEKKALEILRLIKDYIETSRYFIGLLVALLDLNHDRLEEDRDNYFLITNSYLMLYKRNDYYFQKKIKNCLKYYPIRREFNVSLKSVKVVFETFVFKEYKDLRIHNAHTDFDVEQDKLKERIYKVKVSGKDKSYNLDELNRLWNNYFSFFLNFKFLIAREYFSEDDELIRYIENRPKPVVFRIYPGDIIREEDSES